MIKQSFYQSFNFTCGLKYLRIKFILEREREREREKKRERERHISL